MYTGKWDDVVVEVIHGLRRDSRVTARVLLQTSIQHTSEAVPFRPSVSVHSGEFYANDHGDHSNNDGLWNDVGACVLYTAVDAAKPVAGVSVADCGLGGGDRMWNLVHIAH